jgi:hypothetical protein
VKEKDMVQKLADMSFTQHPAWPSFVEEMKNREYGQEPLQQAWGFYKSGWEARNKLSATPA